MNEIWSKYIQGTRTLYLSRKLRFDDRFAGQYLPLFGLDEEKDLRLLEVGCGPGATAAALRRWYPRAAIIGLDRDSAFLAFARDHVPGVEFSEGDAAALPFGDRTFDVTLSNTVSEHIPHDGFFGEQYRVLKPGGVCVVIATRRSIDTPAPCLKDDEFEEAFWRKAAEGDDTRERYAVGKYAMSEAELPAAMERYGFRRVTSGFVTLDLTPDDPATPRELGEEMLEARRQNDLETIDVTLAAMPGRFTAAEGDEMVRRVKDKYDRRLAQLYRGEKQWDTQVTVAQVVRGVK